MKTWQARAAALRREWKQVRRQHPVAVKRSLMGGGAVAAVATVAGLAFVVGLWTGLPDRDSMDRLGEMAQATAVYDRRDGLAFTIYKEQRIEVPLGQMSPHLLAATLAVEDQRFYEHRGFDIRRIVGAALANVRSGRVVQGASTITQQLARQSFLTRDRTYRRKLQEVILAGRIERQYSKDRILELYLNKVYFGDGLYGVEAASRGFFGKHASELSLAEGALLAGLVQSPSTYAPTVNTARAITRRNVVLQEMRQSGVIDAAQWESATKAEVVLVDGLRAEEPYGQYFKEQVRRELIDRFGFERVYEGGLRVFSTIDMSMQKAAEVSVADGLKALDGRREALAQRREALEQRRAAARTPATAPTLPAGSPGDADAPMLQAALVAMDPGTGHVRAMIGGRNFAESSFNRAVQAERQPGSAFKPFVYAAALEAGLTPATMIDRLNEPIDTLQGAWTPEDEHSTADAMSLRTGLRTSSNRAAVRLLQQVGIPATVQYAKTMGVGDVPSVPSLALGSGEVTLQAMTAAYAAFANKGRVPQAMVIRRVEDRDGRVLFAAEEKFTQAVSEATAFLMAGMLADVINAGTGARARALGFTLPAAGKTGTTNEYRDAWFVGFTPMLVTGVWVGFDEPRTILPNGFASDIAVPVWASFMKAATRGNKPVWLSPPAGITTAVVCRLSGLLATEGCEHVEVIEDDGTRSTRSMIYTEYFAKGTAPDRRCDLHPTRGFFGAIASVFSGSEKPAPPRMADTGAPTASPIVVVPPPPAVAEVAPPPPEPPKRRGFWGRVFGRGERDKSEPKPEPAPRSAR